MYCANHDMNYQECGECVPCLKEKIGILEAKIEELEHERDDALDRGANYHYKCKELGIRINQLERTILGAVT
jgi:hypothetical protein